MSEKGGWIGESRSDCPRRGEEKGGRPGERRRKKGARPEEGRWGEEEGMRGEGRGAGERRERIGTHIKSTHL